jgi:ketosteroid isomerase-like protein
MLCAAPSPAGADEADDRRTLTDLLTQFLAGASRNDVATHERFWADDLIYTSSAGRRMGKADILRDLRSAAQPPAANLTYSAEDVRVQLYGSTAVVAFRLVRSLGGDGRTQVTKFWNTGTFVKRDGRWSAVAWQATEIH